MRELNTVPIDGTPGLHRDIATHAVININNTEYEAFLRQRELLKRNKNAVSEQAAKIESLERNVSELKQMIAQLINRDTNGTSSTPK